VYSRRSDPDLDTSRLADWGRRLEKAEALRQFWLNWGVQAAVALATFAAVLVALFGQAFRAKFFPPRLAVNLADPLGEKTQARLTWFEDGVQKERSEDARYYHLAVRNSRRWSPANQVQVVLLAVEQPGADGRFVATWTGDIPLGWRHQQVYSGPRTIGPTGHVDLCSVVKGKWLQLHPLVMPFNLEVVKRNSANLILRVQARSNEADSAILSIQVSWDGQWHDGATEMQRHLVVRVMPDHKEPLGRCRFGCAA
jgi:hypothetical protein